MDEFLGAALDCVNSVVNTGDHRDAFTSAMKQNQAIFGRYAFTKHTGPNERKKPFNVVLFEVFATLFAEYNQQRTLPMSNKLRAGYYELLNHPRFVSAISSGTTSPENVNTRFSMAENMMRSILGAP